VINSPVARTLQINNENYPQGNTVFCDYGTNDSGALSSAVIHGRSNGSYAAQFGAGCTRHIKVRGVYADDNTNRTQIKVTPSNASYTSVTHVTEVARSSSSAFWFSAFRTSAGSNNSFYFRGDGEAFADGAWSGGGADYSEYFESADGASIPLGKCVVIEPNSTTKVCLVREYRDGDLMDDIIGVVRAKTNCQGASFIGNNHDDKWKHKYVTNDFGEYLMEEYTVYKWVEDDVDGFAKEHAYEEASYTGTIPDHAEAIVLERRKLNPEFNESWAYVSYEKRGEKILVSLVGQIQKLNDGVVKPNWKKCYDISPLVEMWYIK
jgi:hypothetical protein